MESEEIQALKAEIERLKARLNEGAPKADVTLKIESRTVTRFVGLRQAARTLGISSAHLSYVLHGHRTPGAALRTKLLKMGIEIPAAK